MPCVCRTVTPEEEKEISVFKMASLLGPGRHHPQKHMTDKSLTSSHSDLLALEAAEGNNFLRRTKDAVITLQNVLEGKHNTEIEESLNHSSWDGLSLGETIHVRSVDMTCVCRMISLLEDRTTSPFRIVLVAMDCGNPVPSGNKCGS
ncbi:hypothetical protein EJB05_38294, partial [Eragrostis curvula]